MAIRKNNKKGKDTGEGVKPPARKKLRPRDQITPEYAWRVRQEALEYALEVLSERQNREEDKESL